MAAVWDFLAGSKEITDEELPLPEDMREASPEGRSVWGEIADFILGGEVKDSDLPAPEDRVVDGKSPSKSPKRATSPKRSSTELKATPSRDSSKRGRDQTAPAGVSPAVAVVEEKLATAASAKRLTRDELTEYLTEKGEQVPPNAKKDQLLTLARAASQAEASPKPAEVASPKVKPPAEEAEADEDENPTLNWPIAKLRRLAEEKKVELPPKALKHEIYEALIEAKPRRSGTAKSKASLARKSSSMTRASSKKK